MFPYAIIIFHFVIVNIHCIMNTRCIGITNFTANHYVRFLWYESMIRNTHFSILFQPLQLCPLRTSEFLLLLYPTAFKLFPIKLDGSTFLPVTKYASAYLEAYKLLGRAEERIPPPPGTITTEQGTHDIK